MPQAAAQQFFGEDGLLARVLPGYEERPSQRKLSEAVERTLQRGGLLLAEAGCEASPHASGLDRQLQ